ncbi:MAG: conserved membrane protein of unknown function [Promethearchaeota archaeon]|nr:MAG: conserved membrane protein of unknown function [Candidatus Lokiarchaeota archaeon]
MLGLWLMFTVKFFKTIGYYRDLNSPFNTLIFVLSPPAIGLVYSFWGYFTGLFDYNILGTASIGLSVWNLFFAFPYLMYGIYSLYACFKKFDVVYIYRSKSIKAKTMGYFLFIFILINGIVILAMNMVISQGFFFLTPTNPWVDLSLIIVILILIIVFIRYAIFYNKRSLSELSPELMEQRMRSIERRSRPSSSASSRPRQRSSSKSRSTTTRRVSRTSSKSSKGRKPSRIKGKISISDKDLKNYRPKGSILSPEDFKCIFCFEYPRLPQDEGRGVVLCPNCKHPAHADEFKDWHRSSNLCSRCNAVIPPSYRENPKVIPIKVYRKIVKAILEKEKKK